MSGLYEPKVATIALATEQCLLLACLYVLTSRLSHADDIADYNNVVFNHYNNDLLALSKSVVLICALRFVLFNHWKF